MLDKLMFFYHIFTNKVSLLQIINTRTECIQNKLVQVVVVKYYNKKLFAVL